MGSARYKTSDDGRFRLYIQQTGVSGNNAVLSAWVSVKTDYSGANEYIISNPKITVGTSSATGSVKTGSTSSSWIEIYRRTGISAAYPSGSTTGSVQVSASGLLAFYNGDDQVSVTNESVSAWFDFDTRTISGSITATNAAIGAKPTFTIGSYSSGYTYGITYSIGTASGTVATTSQITSGTYNGWTIPAEIGSQIQSSSTGTITYTLTTYSGGTAVGSSSCTASVTVPSYTYTVTAPTASKATYSTIGAYVAGKTKVSFDVSAPPSVKYGASYTYTASITQAGTTLASQNYTAAGTIQATPVGIGSVTCTVTMTDSRGVTKSATASVTYVENVLPTASLTAYRVASSGSTAQSITGAYYYASASGTYNNISGNSCTLTLTCGGSSSTASGSSGSVSKTASGSLAATNTLSVTVKVQDALGNVATKTATVPQGFAVIQLGTGSDHKGVSIGKVGQISEAGKLEVAYRTDFDNDVYIQGVKVTPGGGGGGGSGTITGVSVNGTSVATSGVANITSIPGSIVSGAVPDATNATNADTANKAISEACYATGSSDTAGRWTATIPGIASLYDGLTIKIRLTKSYNGTFNTLNLNNLGEQLVWYRSNARMTSHIPQYGVIALTYYSGNTMASLYAMTNAYAPDYVDKGTWAASTAYVVGNRVKNGSTYYICKTAHTSGSSFSSTNWNTWSSVTTTLSIAATASYNITGGWFLEYQYQDGNDPNYRSRDYNDYVKSIANIGRYQVILYNRNCEIFSVNTTNNSTSTSKTGFTTREFDPFGKIAYYTATTEYADATTWSTGGNFYDRYESVDLRYSFNISSSVNKLTTYLPVYLVATPQINGMAKLYYGANGTTYSACLTQTLPTTDNGLIYIYLGQARSTYQITLRDKKPVYWYKNGIVCPYLGVPLYSGSVT